MKLVIRAVALAVFALAAACYFQTSTVTVHADGKPMPCWPVCSVNK